MAAVSLRKEVNEKELLSCCIAMKKAKSNKITKATKKKKVIQFKKHRDLLAAVVFCNSCDTAWF